MKNNTISPSDIENIYAHLKKRYGDIEDPWGLNLSKSQKSIKLAHLLYKNYFKVRVIGSENVIDERPLLVVGNHTGQLPYDAMLTSLAFMLEVKPPRILRAMIERFVTSLPFFNTFIAENGAVLGDRSNAYHLLKRGESLLIFPEGVRGVSKSRNEYYELQSFTRGFFRMALKTGVDILPVAIVGAEEFFPFVYHPKKLAKSLGFPAMPLSPFFPGVFGPLGPIPLPSPIDIHFGKIYELPKDLDAEAPDKYIDEHVFEIENIIKDKIDFGLKNRRPYWGSFFAKNKI